MIHAQYVTDWICNEPGVEKEIEIDYSLLRAIFVAMFGNS
jgi:hypothetical protein